jgi:predicted AAA+ superfamily ATPase
MVQKYLETTPYHYSFETGTLRTTQEKFFNGPRKEVIDDYGMQYPLVVIDEAQAILNIGENMKALVDLYPSIRVILTGSSSFDLSGQIGEPLLGRQTFLHLYPFWEHELLQAGLIDPGHSLEQALLFGRYPEIVTTLSREQKIRKLQGLAGASLFKDVLAFDRLKKPQVILDILSYLAFQIGSEVSLTEIATQVGVDQKTVERYLTILERAFILFPLRAFSKNPRKELRKKKKYYFYDLGIRNATINNFHSLSARADVGALWENFCIVERMKKNAYTNTWVQPFFWRSLSGSEIDYVEIRNGEIHAYEYKWNPKKRAAAPKTFMEKYAGASFSVITPASYRPFVCP